MPRLACRRLAGAAWLFLCLAPCMAVAAPPPPLPGNGTPDVAALVACEGEPTDFLALVEALQDPLRAVALGWRPVPQRNLFLSEYTLASPIHAFGHATRHIALSADNIVAVLDLADPRPLAAGLDLEALIDTPDKAMFGRELRSQERTDPDTGTVRLESVILNVSNVASHPGQTLAGCSYGIETLAETAPSP